MGVGLYLRFLIQYGWSIIQTEFVIQTVLFFINFGE